MPPVIAAVVAVVTTIAIDISAVAANIALAAGAGSALADGISAAVFTLASTGIEVGVLMGASALLKPHLNVGGGGMQTAFQADPQAGVPYAVGRTGTGANNVFADVAGTKNQDLTYVAVLSAGGPIEAIESFSIDGNIVAFNGSGACTTAPYAGHTWQIAQLGAAGASALSISGGPSIPPEWGSSEKLSGKAAAIWSLRLDQSVITTTPKPLWVIKGAKIYDPRADSTYPGGSGSQRLATPSTWAYSENPYLHALNWGLGIYENGKRIMGVGAPWAAIDVAAFVEGANVADANGWKVGGVVYSTDDKFDVLTAMLQAGGGAPLKLAARISCLIGTPRVSLATLTGKDVCGDVSIGAAQSRRTRINKIWPRYREEAAGWALTPTDAPVVVSAYVTADGEERSRQVDYQLVQDATQVSQLARLDIENAREFGPCVFPCFPRWWGFKPGDCITVNEPEYGLNGQTVLIVDRQIDPATMNVTLTCRSETAGKYPFALGQTGSPPPTPGITGVDPNLVNPPGGAAWSMTGSSFVGSGQLPALIIGGAVDDPNAQDILVDWRERLTPTPTWGPWSTTIFPASATLLTIPAVKDNTWYGAQVRYRTMRGVDDFSAALDLGVVETGTIEIPDQGLLATLDNIEDAQLAAGVGVNCLVDTNFSQGWNYYRSGGDNSNTQSVQTAGGVAYLQNVMTGSSGQSLFIASDNQVDSLPCQPGQFLELSSGMAGANLSSIRLEVRFHDASGVAITSISTGAGNGFEPPLTSTSTISSASDPAAWPRIFGLIEVPATAARASLWVRGICSGGSATLKVFEPLLAKARDGTTDPTPFNPGFRGDPVSDQTSTHTAAAIAGQAATATSSDFAVVTGTTKPANNADVTASHTAAAITGQAAAATDSSIEAGATINKTFSQTSDPAPVADGAVWHDEANGVTYLRNGGAWKAVSGTPIDGQVIFQTSTGGSSGTYTVPANALPFVTVMVKGGPGGDGFEAGSIGLGGEGGTSSLHFAVTPGTTTIAWVCGAGGIGFTATNGTAGSASTATSSGFSGTMSGGGGSGGGNGTPGAGGTASGPTGSTNTSGASGLPTGSVVTITAHSS